MKKKERKESSKREKTWEKLIQICYASNKGFELNTESVSDITKEINKKGENIFENGPKTLNSVSNNITVDGNITAITVVFYTTPSTGGAIIATTNLITAPIDLTADGLHGIRLIRDPSSKSAYELSTTIVEIGVTAKMGKMLYKSFRSSYYINNFLGLSNGGMMGF